MAHTAQERYSQLVDMKLRAGLATVDNLIFNPRYEGSPKAGKVKIPVRDTEVATGAYNKATGLTLGTGTTTYADLDLDQDIAVNEIIDGFDAASVPDGIVAERLDSAGYSLSLALDKYSVGILETQGTVNATKTALTKDTVYKYMVDERTRQSRAGVPLNGRWALVSPEVYGLMLQDTTNFIKSGDLSQELVAAGAIGKYVGYVLFESNNMMVDNLTIVGTKKTTTEIITGHPDWCHRVMEWAVPVGLKDLSNNFIGASAVQGRKVYGAKVSKAAVVGIKRTEVAA